MLSSDDQDETDDTARLADGRPDLGSDDDDRQLLILYASQTGSAQDVAEFIGREAWRRHFRATVQDVRDFEKTQLADAPLTVIVTSTTGQGAFPTSMLNLWNFLLRGDLPSELLEHFNYALFGLGDSSYPRFNWPVRKLKRRLDSLGANEIIEKGEADDQHYLGVDGTLLPWLDSLWSTLLQHYPLPADLKVIPSTRRPPPRIVLRKVPTNGHKEPRHDIVAAWPRGMRCATLQSSQRVTAPDHFQDTRLMTFQFEKDVQYLPGDILELRPENLSNDVNKFLELMRWDTCADVMYMLRPRDNASPLPAHWPKSASPRQLFTLYLDIFSVPRRSFFEWLSYFTISDMETEKLREYCTPEGQEDMYDYANRPRRTIYEVLTEFKSAKIPLDYITDIFPEIRPRQFSIASSAKTSRRNVDILCAIVSYKTKLKIPRRGVATAWLSTLQPGHKVAVDIVTGSMRLPEDPSVPIVLIGPGTGIAPFRSFIQERVANETRTENLVFFGCRSAEKDFYFKQEWQDLEVQGKVKLVLAASRDGDDKIYVQHRIQEAGELVWGLLDQGAYVYISGSANQMPKAVQKALKTVISKFGGMDEAGADAYFAQMESQGRYQEETWS